jgi:hypothetical protein
LYEIVVRRCVEAQQGAAAEGNSTEAAAITGETLNSLVPGRAWSR